MQVTGKCEACGKSYTRSAKLGVKEVVIVCSCGAVIRVMTQPAESESPGLSPAAAKMLAESQEARIVAERQQRRLEEVVAANSGPKEGDTHESVRGEMNCVVSYSNYRDIDIGVESRRSATVHYKSNVISVWRPNSGKKVVEVVCPGCREIVTLTVWSRARIWSSRLLCVAAIIISLPLCFFFVGIFPLAIAIARLFSRNARFGVFGGTGDGVLDSTGPGFGGGHFFRPIGVDV